MTEIDLSGLVIVGAVAFCAPLVLGLVPAFRLAAVVLELVAGIVVGPSVLGWVEIVLPDYNCRGGVEMKYQMGETMFAIGDGGSLGFSPCTRQLTSSPGSQRSSVHDRLRTAGPAPLPVAVTSTTEGREPNA